VPGWHEATLELQREGRVQLVGLIQEQHPDRCRLFMQWKDMDWPVLIDPVNITESKAVPLVWAIDEFGIVRAVNPQRSSITEEFIEQTWPAPTTAPNTTAIPSRASPDQQDSAAWHRAEGDVLLLHDDDQVGALASYLLAVELDPADGRNHFRLGVALRMRFDSGRRQPGDFQSAVAGWTTALTIDPNHYIWRRRIQQYGPRLEKPYPFYDWVAQARSEITARGDVPSRLRVEPRGSEIARPSRELIPAGEVIGVIPDHPDPRGVVLRDPGPEGTYVEMETAVVPAVNGPGEAVKIHLVFRPNDHSHWNNEAEPLRVWLTLPEGWQADRTFGEAVPPPDAVSDEERIIEFELVSPAAMSPGIARIQVEMFYNVCLDDGLCLFRRKDAVVEVNINNR